MLADNIYKYQFLSHLSYASKVKVVVKPSTYMEVHQCKLKPYALLQLQVQQKSKPIPLQNYTFSKNLVYAKLVSSPTLPLGYKL